MKRIFKFYLLPALLVLSVSSCKKSFEDLTQNNNVPTSVPASLLLNGVLNNMVDFPDGQDEIWCQYYIYNYNYYGNNQYNFGSGDNYYSTLKNVLAMEQQAQAAGAPAVNPYSALGKFFRAYFFSKMSLDEGDIPMTQALQGLKNLTPKYDTQKAVMTQCLAWLESANSDMTSLISSGNTAFSGDIFLNNNLAAWQKVVNAFHIRLLLELSKKAVTDPDMNIPSQFAAIIGDPAKYPLMASSADNLQYTFVTPSNFYPMNPNNFGQNGSRQNSSQTYIKLLTTFQDPRVYVVAEPARHYVDDLHQSPTAFSSFVGADPGEDLGQMYADAGLQYFSFINRHHYYSTYTGEPSIQIGYPEQEFEIAEGINRGWATGNAETYYVNGIQASWAYYSIPATGSFTAFFYRPGSTDVTNLGNYDTYPINTDWNTYYNQPVIKYAGGATGLTQILQQKYLALFRHSGLESYFTYRRTGVPNFTTGPGTGNGQRIAMRFQYPSSERTANTTNYTAALQSQYSGNDDINGIMWILK
ncbi:MAG: SusD/RagB family nutrient-binding outer membrane lipoprotein [Bacteroidetes bacterium]|nr:SusD/RagB family nutrient-binding outer membrane lipoprotein [Bacteroidota bacterium]